MRDWISAQFLMTTERAITMVALAVVIILAWIYTLSGSALPEPESAMGGSMDMSTAWTPGQVLIVFTMWWVMMIAMMVPSAAPMVLLFSAVKRSRGEAEALPQQLSAFLGGYLTVWGAFSVAAVGAQWQLDTFQVLTPELSLANGWIAGMLLVAAGLYQLTPVKQACLSQCRSPAVILARYWRPGAVGAFVMGVQHGRFCLACCSFLMLLLFVGGIMNVWWIAGLAVYVGLEKLAPAGGRLGLITGAVLAGSGILVALGELY